MLHPYEQKDKFLTTLFFKLKPNWNSTCRPNIIGASIGLNIADLQTLINLLVSDRLVGYFEKSNEITLTDNGVQYILNLLKHTRVIVLHFESAHYLPPASKMIFGYRFIYEIDNGESVDHNTIDVFVSDLVAMQWGLQFVQNGNAEKILLLLAKDRIIEKVKEGSLNEYEELIMMLKDVPVERPFSTDQYLEVSNALFVVEIATKPLSEVMNNSPRATSIIETIDHINALFQYLEKDDLLVIHQVRDILCFFKEVKTQDEFVSAIASLFNIVGCINVKKLRALLSDPNNKDHSITLLEKYLTSQSMNCVEVVKVFRAIGKIRKGFPIHIDRDIVQGCHDLGLEYPIEDYESSWILILSHYQAAISKIKNFLKASR
jgi:hypothetical protein